MNHQTRFPLSQTRLSYDATHTSNQSSNSNELWVAQLTILRKRILECVMCDAKRRRMDCTVYIQRNNENIPSIESHYTKNTTHNPFSRSYPKRNPQQNATKTTTTIFVMMMHSYQLFQVTQTHTKHIHNKTQ